jgi:hypothetical protein
MPTINNTITMTNYWTPFDKTQFYYIVFPDNSAATGTYNKAIPVTSITTNASGNYVLTVNNVNDLRVTSSNLFYGPYLYLTSFNSSLFYYLPFFPGSLTFPVTYSIQLQSITIPNRPILEYIPGGARTINDLAYIYVSVYNVDSNGNFDTTILNVVYTNTSLPNLSPSPIFLLPGTNPGTASNFVTFTSSRSANIVFTNNYLYLRVRVLDPDGNVILFDQSITKSTDIFINNIIPQKYLNCYLRLALTKK